MVVDRHRVRAAPRVPATASGSTLRDLWLDHRQRLRVNRRPRDHLPLPHRLHHRGVPRASPSASSSARPSSTGRIVDNLERPDRRRRGRTSTTGSNENERARRPARPPRATTSDSAPTFAVDGPARPTMPRRGRSRVRGVDDDAGRGRRRARPRRPGARVPGILWVEPQLGARRRGRPSELGRGARHVVGEPDVVRLACAGSTSSRRCSSSGARPTTAATDGPGTSRPPAGGDAGARALASTAGSSASSRSATAPRSTARARARRRARRRRCSWPTDRRCSRCWRAARRRCARRWARHRGRRGRRRAATTRTRRPSGASGAGAGPATSDRRQLSTVDDLDLRRRAGSPPCWRSPTCGSRRRRALRATATVPTPSCPTWTPLPRRDHGRQPSRRRPAPRPRAWGRGRRRRRGRSARVRVLVIAAVLGTTYLGEHLPVVEQRLERAVRAARRRGAVGRAGADVRRPARPRRRSATPSEVAGGVLGIAAARARRSSRSSASCWRPQIARAARPSSVDDPAIAAGAAGARRRSCCASSCPQVVLYAHRRGRHRAC